MTEDEHAAAAAAVGEDPNTYVPGRLYEKQGMVWLVIGFGPGVELLATTNTRALANDWIRSHTGKTFDSYAVMKARDFYTLP